MREQENIITITGQLYQKTFGPQTNCFQPLNQHLIKVLKYMLKLDIGIFTIEE